MAHVGDVHADFPVSVLEFLDRQRIVKVLGVGGVDGESCHTAHVAPLGDFLGRDARLQSLGGLGDILGILVRQAELGKDGMDLGIVLARHAQHVNHFADGRVGVLGPVHDFRHHLVAGLTTGELVQRDEDICSQELAVGCQLCEVFQHLQRTHEHLLLAFQDFHDLGLGFQPVSGGTNVHQHTVPVERMHRVALGDHDGQSVIAGCVHAVLAVAATDEDALGNRRPVHGLETAGSNLCQETVHRQLFENLDDEGAPFGRVGPDGSRHLLVIEWSLSLLIKEVDDAVVEFTPFQFQRLQSAFSCHIWFGFVT